MKDSEKNPGMLLFRCAAIGKEAFSEATDLFRFRRIPYFHFSTDYVLVFNGERFTPLSVEDVKGRGMYIEVLAKKVVSTSG